MEYNIIKAVHIISIVAWFAGCFYIFRLLVYHAQNQNNPQMCTVFETMEKKLLRIIMNPAMGLTIITGIWMIVINPAWMKMGWLHTKLLMVIFLIGYHHYALYVSKKFAKKQFILTEKQCRLINEVPTVILIVIVFLVELKPF
jgi:putative membrane protein